MARIRRASSGLVTCWCLAATVAWGGMLASLPGYFRYYGIQPVQLQFDSQSILITRSIGLASLICALISLSLATFIFLRRPDDRGALFVSFYLLMYGFVMAGPMEMVEFLFTGQSGVVSYRIQGVLFIPVAIFLLLMFPNGKITPPQLRWLIPPLLFIPTVMLLLKNEEILSLVSLRSQIVYGITGALFLCALGGQVYRYLKKSTPLERQQTKVFLFGTVIQFLFLSVSSSLFAQLSLEEQTNLNAEYLGGALFWFFSLTILPFSLTLAVVRSHLWDIDVVIRRTLIYGFLSALLALLYFGSVVVMQYAFRLMIGHETPLAIVITTLVIAGLFTPLRARIQAVIDRRFFRSKYNAEQALMRFQRGMRERADLGQVEKELTDIVQVTVQPEWMMMWVRVTPPSGSAPERSEFPRGAAPDPPVSWYFPKR